MRTWCDEATGAGCWDGFSIKLQEGRGPGPQRGGEKGNRQDTDRTGTSRPIGPTDPAFSRNPKPPPLGGGVFTVLREPPTPPQLPRRAAVPAMTAIEEMFAHSGHNSGRPCGHSSLICAVDAQIAVKRDASENIVATLELSKRRGKPARKSSAGSFPSRSAGTRTASRSGHASSSKSTRPPGRPAGSN